jgi:hypothetical protein
MAHILSLGHQAVIAFSGAVAPKQPVADAIDPIRDLSPTPQTLIGDVVGVADRRPDLSAAPSTRTVGSSGGVADDDTAGGGGVAGIWVNAEDGAGSLAAVGLGVDVHGGERGAGERAVAVVVEADDGQVGRSVQPERPHGRQDAQRHVVVEGGDGGYPRPGGQEFAEGVGRVRSG